LEELLTKPLKKLADSKHREAGLPKAIDESVTVNAWQIKEIKKAVKEADHGEFASDHELRKFLNKWTKNTR